MTTTTPAGRRGTHEAVEVEDLVALVGVGPREAVEVVPDEAADGRREGRDVARDEEKKLDEVEADEVVPLALEPGRRRIGVLRAGAMRKGCQSALKGNPATAAAPRGGTHVVRPIGGPDADRVDLREPPGARVLAARADSGKRLVVDKVVEPHRPDVLAQAECFLDLEPDAEDEAGRAEPAEGREEELWVGVARARDDGRVGEDERQAEDAGRDDRVARARAVRRRRDDAAERLVRDRADVRHGQVVRAERPVKGVERDARLSLDDRLLLVDLKGEWQEGAGTNVQEASALVCAATPSSRSRRTSTSASSLSVRIM